MRRSANGHPRTARRHHRLRSALPAGAALAAALTVGPAAPLTAEPAASARVLAAPAKAGNAVIAWGLNSNGQLGNGTTTSTSKPVFALPGTKTRYTTVRTGMTSLALSTAGRVYGWGDNAFGQIGDGTTTDRLRPVPANQLNGVKVTALRGGITFTMVLTSAGKVLAWGFNGDGELGDGTTTNRPTPVRVRIPKGVTITAITIGNKHALALTKSGRVLAWGANNVGQLGDGTTTDRHTPVYVRLPRHTKVTSIAAGTVTGYAVTSVGKLLAWGFNGEGQLGDGTTTNRTTPVQVRLPHGVKVTAATAGYLDALALTTDGRALAWGNNGYGQLGDGSTADRHVPTFVKLPRGARVRALAGGEDFSMALTRGGHILTWGRNNFGQLGNGTTADSHTPVTMPLPLGFVPTAIGAGTFAETGLAIGNQTN